MSPPNISEKKEEQKSTVTQEVKEEPKIPVIKEAIKEKKMTVTHEAKEAPKVDKEKELEVKPEVTTIKNKTEERTDGNEGDEEEETETETELEVIELTAENEGSFAPLHVDVFRLHARGWQIPLKVGPVNVLGMLDSGAQMTVIRPDVIASLPEKLRNVKTCNLELMGINGIAKKVDGIARIPIKIGSRNLLTDVVVAPIRDAILIGMNFIQYLDAEVSFGKGTIKLGQEEIVMQREGDFITSTRLASRRAEIIMPRTESVISLKTATRTIKSSTPMMVEPLKAFINKSGLIMGRTMTRCNGKEAKVLVANPTDCPIRIEKGDTLAFASPVTEMYGALENKTEEEDHDVIPDYESIVEKMPPHLKELVERTVLARDQKTLCAQLVTEYSDVFMSPEGPLGRTSATTHKIFTGDNAPIKQRKRRVPMAQNEMIDRELNKMLKLGVIEPSSSPWSSQIVLVRKKNGQIRFCVDYRCLNTVTRKDSYPLPNIMETFDTLAGAQYFSSLDLASGYWQVEVAPEDKEKTAFSTRHGLYQFTTMPFGLCNAPATFERLMDTILHGYLWERCMCYIDDIIVYGQTFNHAVENLRAVLDRVRACGLKLQAKKCDLFKRELLYLGFIVSGQGVKPDPAKLSSIREWPVPCTVTDVRSFLGFANYHRRFVKDYAVVAEPLLDVTRGAQKFFWGRAQQNAFEELQQALLDVPTLNHPETGLEHEFVLDTDASGFAVGGALSQKINGVEHPIGFASKTLSRTQRNYCTTYRELYAIVEMITHFRHYLWGRKFLLRTDHSSLRWLKNYSDADGMLARWLAKLEQYDFRIEHRAGKNHGNADGLSRCHSCKNENCPGKPVIPTTDTDSSDGEFPIKRVTCVTDPEEEQKGLWSVEGDGTGPRMSRSNLSNRQAYRIRTLDVQIDRQQWLSQFSKADVREAQKADSRVGKVYEWVEKKDRPSNKEIATYGEEVKTLMARWKQLTIEDGVLVRHVREDGTPREICQIVLPAPLRELVLHQLHDLRIVGHLGIQRTVGRVKHRFYWPGVALDVTRWCARCTECASRKGKPHPRRRPLTQLPTGAPFDRIAMDILDTHKPTAKRNRYILVISDYFTKFTMAFPLRRHTAKNVANVVVNQWIVLFGVPKAIHSDQGREFESSLFRGVIELLGSKKIRTAPYRPQSDGQVERMNRTILQLLSAFVSDRANDWDVHLPYVMMAYRSSVHSSTGCTPHIMVFGRETNLPIDLIFPSMNEEELPSCGTEYVEYLRSMIRTTHEFAREHLRQAGIRQKRGYDAHAKATGEYKPGDLVRYYYVPLTQGNKFARPWTGPWKVESQETEVDYKIALLSNPKKTRVVHFDVLKPYERLEDDVVETQPGSDQSKENESDILESIRDLYAPWKVTTDNEALLSNSSEEKESSESDTNSMSDQFDGVVVDPELINKTTQNIPRRSQRPQRQRRRPQRYGFTDSDRDNR